MVLVGLAVHGLTSAGTAVALLALVIVGTAVVVFVVSFVGVAVLVLGPSCAERAVAVLVLVLATRCVAVLAVGSVRIAVAGFEPMLVGVAVLVQTVLIQGCGRLLPRCLSCSWPIMTDHLQQQQDLCLPKSCVALTMWSTCGAPEAV